MGLFNKDTTKTYTLEDITKLLTSLGVKLPNTNEEQPVTSPNLISPNTFDNAPETIARKAEVIEANARFNARPGNGVDVEDTLLTQISKLQLPAIMGLDWWYRLTWWVDFYVKACGVKFKNKADKAFYYFVKVACMLGYAIIDKVGDTLVAGYPNNVITDLNGDIVGCDTYTPASILLASDTPFNHTKNGISLKDSKVKKIKPSKNAVYLKWRSSGVGDYIYYMKEILTDILLTQYEKCMACSIPGKMLTQVNNVDTISEEYSKVTNPYQQTVLQIRDNQNKIPNKFTYFENGGQMENYTALTSLHKEITNDWYQRAGLPTTSSKYQTASADIEVNEINWTNSLQIYIDLIDYAKTEVKEMLGVTIMELEPINEQEENIVTGEEESKINQDKEGGDNV